MKKLMYAFFIMVLAVSIVGFTSCGNNKESDETTDDTTATETTEELVEGGIPFDFPVSDIKAEIGDFVLVPSFKMWESNLEEEDPTNQTYIFYAYKMSELGEVESTVEFTFDGEQKMPNSIIIPIPQNQTAQKGDIVLTWWQTGSGMQRALIVDDSNPAQPKVLYLDLDYDNPATDSESGKPIGQTVYDLEANSFVKLNDGWQQGNMIAAKDGDDWVSTQIVKISGNKVLTIGFAGRMKVYAKADCKTIPLNPGVKVGDVVQAEFAGKFGEYTVTKVDASIGRVFVDQYGSEKAVPYGQVIKKL
jgi:hypothetical protein